MLGLSGYLLGFNYRAGTEFISHFRAAEPKYPLLSFPFEQVRALLISRNHPNPQDCYLYVKQAIGVLFMAMAVLMLLVKNSRVLKFLAVLTVVPCLLFVAISTMLKFDDLLLAVPGFDSYNVFDYWRRYLGMIGLLGAVLMY